MTHFIAVLFTTRVCLWERIYLVYTSHSSLQPSGISMQQRCTQICGTLLWAPCAFIPWQVGGWGEAESGKPTPNKQMAGAVSCTQRQPPPSLRKRACFTKLPLQWEFWTAHQEAPNGNSDWMSNHRVASWLSQKIRWCSVPLGSLWPGQLMALSNCLHLQTALPWGETGASQSTSVNQLAHQPKVHIFQKQDDSVEIRKGAQVCLEVLCSPFLGLSQAFLSLFSALN